MSARAGMTSISDSQATAAPASRSQTIGCFLLLLVGLHLAAGPVVQLSSWRVDPATNHALAEALAWRDGRLTLPGRMHDSALFEGRVYNVFPPLLTLLAYAAVTVGPLLGVAEGQFYAPWYVAMVALPLPLVGYWMFLRVVGRPAWAALFTAIWILATPVLPCLSIAREAGINQVNHLLSQTGLMLIVGSLLGRRSDAPGLVGLVIATWSRPTCILYAIPQFVAAWRDPSPRHTKRITAVCASVAVSLSFPMALSWAKFGSPFESGYRYIYEGRKDELARRGREALFSTANIPRNAWHMNFELPGWELGSYGIRPTLNAQGASIWFTMPLLAFCLIDVRRWWRVCEERRLMLTTLAVIVGLLLYHNTGYIQPGYYRFSLDFLPAWLAIVASRSVLVPDRLRWILAASAWSMVYFRLVTEMYG